jgi:predicted amidohydrolase
MLIAAVQSDVTFADPDANVQRVLEWMHRAAGRRARPTTRPAELVVFPECMLTGYTYDSRQHAFQVALKIDDPRFERLALAARQLKQWITIGFLEREGNRLFNSAALVGPDGVAGCYRKIHLPHLGVDRFVDRGDRPYQASRISPPQGPPLRVGLAICYDASFPEPIRVLGLVGTDVIALGTNWPVEATHTAAIVPRARSMENHLYFVAANRVGRENEFEFCGRSSICGPDGTVLASSDDATETLLTAHIDPAVAQNKRIERTPGKHMIDRFADRRPEFYGPITDAPRRGV